MPPSLWAAGAALAVSLRTSPVRVYTVPSERGGVCHTFNEEERVQRSGAPFVYFSLCLYLIYNIIYNNIIYYIHNNIIYSYIYYIHYIIIYDIKIKRKETMDPS